jgi:DNA-binding MarR family transcriptional regulator
VIKGTLKAMADLLESPVERLPYGLLLARLGQESSARFRRSLRPLGIGAQQYFVLKQLQAVGQTSQGALGSALGIDPSNLANLVADLCDLGYASRTRDENDRRRYVLLPSAAGLKLLERADAAIAEGEEQLLSELDEEERIELWELLRRVADAAQLCPGAATPAEEARACAEADPGA